MDLQTLQQKLQDPDQWVRVETLRILAMVEEVRALHDIEWVYKNDPEPGVRQVAQWAGRLIYTAYKQSKRESETQPVTVGSDAEARLISGLIDKDSRTYNLMQGQLLQQEMAEAMRAAPKRSTGPLPNTSPLTLTPPQDDPPDPMALLDAGLSPDFFKGLL